MKQNKFYFKPRQRGAEKKKLKQLLDPLNNDSICSQNCCCKEYISAVQWYVRKDWFYSFFPESVYVFDIFKIAPLIYVS